MQTCVYACKKNLYWLHRIRKDYSYSCYNNIGIQNHWLFYILMRRFLLPFHVVLCASVLWSAVHRYWMRSSTLKDLHTEVAKDDKAEVQLKIFAYFSFWILSHSHIYSKQEVLPYFAMNIDWGTRQQYNGHTGFTTS